MKEISKNCSRPTLMNRAVNSEGGVSLTAIFVTFGIRTPLIAVDRLVMYVLKVAPML